MPKVKLDLQIVSLLEKIAEQGAPPVQTLTPDEARAAKNPVFLEIAGPPFKVEKTTDMNIPGPFGEIPIRVYTPQGEGPFPLFMYFHGGGWVICNLDTHDNVCRYLAEKTPCVVVSVDYRLAPEHKFPAAVEDAYSATKWVSENAELINIDPTRIAVGGDSAGGNLASVVSMISREKGGPPLVLQVLVYPVLDLFAMDTESYREHGEGYILTSEGMKYYRSHYLGPEEDALNPYASPLLAQDLRGLPPALIIAAEYDVLTDEGKAYARLLEEARVPVKYTCYQGMIHAFFNMSGVVDRTKDALDEVAESLSSAF